MTQLEDWADQYRSELEKLSSARAAQIESLLVAGDYEACREWLEQWESEDSEPDSHRSRYGETVNKLRLERQRKINGEASAENLGGSSADLLSQTN